MALINCPDCGKEVSDQAPACPGCGRPIASPPVQPPPSAPAAPSSKKKTSFAALGCLTILVLGAIWLVSLVTPSKNRETSPPKSLQTPEQYVATVESLANFGTFKVETCTATVEALSPCMLVFDLIAQTAEDARKYTLNPDQQAKVAQFKKRAAEFQRRVFPQLRDAYGPALSKVLWEYDVQARTFGAGFRTIEMVGALFAANRNIKEVHGKTVDQLRRLRFNRVQYKWIEHAEKYSYDDIECPDDGDLVIWGGASYRKVQ